MSDGSQKTVSPTLPDTQIPGCSEPSVPAPPGLSLSVSFTTIAEELNETEQHGLEQYFDPWDRTTDASSWGSWSVTGPLSFWELSGEEKGHQYKEKCRDEPRKK